MRQQPHECITPLPHAVMVPYPFQGHVIPLMKLARILASDRHGFDVTFVNTDFVHARISKAAAAENGLTSAGGGRIRLVSVPDGLGLDENRNDLTVLMKAVNEVMPVALEQLIQRLTREDREPTCLILDVAIGWAVDFGARMGLPTGVFSPASVALQVMFASVPRLMQEGYIAANGLPLNQDSLKLAPGMPRMNASNFPWNYAGSPEVQRVFFQDILDSNHPLQRAAFSICNTFWEIEHPALSFVPHALPIGPLLHADCSDDTATSPAHFWCRDPSCKAWLDTQRDRSVVYVAFGSLAVFGLAQLRELSLGLELSGRPFLWVVRPDITEGLQGSNDTEAGAFLYEFIERVGGRGRVVEWAPQEQVLAHGAVACFVSHCGWNSTMEAVCSGVPLLCWPYGGDQFLNRDYICDEWKVGIRLEPDCTGLLTREEFGKKLDELLADEKLRDRMVNLAEKAMQNVERGGLSWNNLNDFIQGLKKGKYLTSR